jgi:hypothetical protein
MKDKTNLFRKLKYQTPNRRLIDNQSLYNIGDSMVGCYSSSTLFNTGEIRVNLCLWIQKNKKNKKAVDEKR